MKDLKEFILEKRIRELKVDGKKVPDKYIAVFNDYLVEIAELIKVHDRELVKEVCEDLTKSILNLKYVNDTREFATYVLSIIKSKQKDFEK